MNENARSESLERRKAITKREFIDQIVEPRFGALVQAEELGAFIERLEIVWDFVSRFNSEETLIDANHLMHHLSYFLHDEGLFYEVVDYLDLAYLNMVYQPFELGQTNSQSSLLPTKNARSIVGHGIYSRMIRTLSGEPIGVKQTVAASTSERSAPPFLTNNLQVLGFQGAVKRLTLEQILQNEVA